MPKKDYRGVRNWKGYNHALVQRGSLTFWFSNDLIQRWHSPKNKTKFGRPEKYNEAAIFCALTLKAVFHLTFRATEGFIASPIILACGAPSPRCLASQSLSGHRSSPVNTRERDSDPNASSAMQNNFRFS